jgi:Bacterial Ig-like domain
VKFRRTARTARTKLLAVLGVLAVAAIAVAISGAAPPLAAPTLTGTSPNPSGSTSASFSFTGPSGATFECRLDGSAFAACTSTKAYTALAAGSHAFGVRAKKSGQTSSETTYAWVIDLTPPSAASIDRLGASPTNAGSVQWTATFSEAVNGVDSSDFTLVNGGLGGSPVVMSVTPNASTLSTTFTVSASTGSGSGTLGLNLVDDDSIVDAAGNKLGGTGTGNGNKTGQVFTIDRTPPATPTITSGPPAWPTVGWPSTSASFGFSGPADAAAFVCRMDTVAAFAGCTSPKSYPGLAQGQHTFEVKAVDAAGNISTTPASRTFFVDTVAPTKPVFSQTPPDPNSTATSTFAWSSTDPSPASGINGYLCSKENGSFQTCSSPHTYAVQVTSNGQHQFAVKAVDAAGNVSQVAEYKWKVGAGSPQLFSVAGSVTGLVPGVWQSIPITITNPNAETLYVTGVTVAISGAPGGCDSSTNMELQQSSASPINKLAVPANAVNWPVPAGPFRPQVRLKNTAVNQDSCKSKTFSLSYSGTGTNQP